MDQEMTFSLSYEQLTRFAEKRIRECNLDSHGVTYLCESAKAGAVLIFWHELAINGYTSMNAIKRQGNDSNLLIVFYVQIMPDDFVMQLHRF